MLAGVTTFVPRENIAMVTRVQPPLQAAKPSTSKYARARRLQYCRAVLLFFFFAFIITLGTCLFWLFASLELHLPSHERFLQKDARRTSRMQAKARLFSPLLELKEEGSMDIYVNSKGKAISKDRDYRLIQQGGNELSLGYKIYVYNLPSKYNKDWLADSRCSSHLFAAEVAIHKALLSSSIRTLDAEHANFFFLPVYVSCNFSSESGFPSLGGASSLLFSAIQLISHEMPFWNRSDGSDHIFVATHDYGACFHAPWMI